MEGRLFSALGQRAGLGGIAFGVFLLLFRGILERRFLPKAGLDSPQAFAVILALMIFTFGLAAIGVIAWLIGRGINPKAPIPGKALLSLACLVVVVIGAAVYVGVQGKPVGTTSSKQASRIEVSKYLLKPIDPTKPAIGYEIDLYMINRGNIPARAPITTFAFNSADGLMSAAEVDAEMGKVLQLALQRLPPFNDNREEIGVGVETWLALPRGLTGDAWKAIASGTKRFYLFVVLTYTDAALGPDQYWITEFCASQRKDFSYFRLCQGHNRTWLHVGAPTKW